MENNLDIIHWDQYFDLSIDDSKLIELLSKYKLEQKEFPECSYLFNKEEGISFCFKQDRKLSHVTLYNDDVDKYHKYKGYFPYDISFKLFNSVIVSRFGDTKNKGGGRTIPIWISYDNLGVSFTFKSFLWEDITNPIAYITLFKRDKNFYKNVLCEESDEKAKKYMGRYKCGVCVSDNDCKIRCKKGCPLLYCSDKCKDILAPIHIKFCNPLV